MCFHTVVVALLLIEIEVLSGNEEQKLIPSLENKSFTIAKISSCKTQKIGDPIKF